MSDPSLMCALVPPMTAPRAPPAHKPSGGKQRHQKNKSNNVQDCATRGQPRAQRQAKKTTAPSTDGAQITTVDAPCEVRPQEPTSRSSASVQNNNSVHNLRVQIVPKGEIGSLARLGSRKAADKLHCDQHCVMGGSAKERKPPAHFWDEDNECKDAWWRGKTAPMSLAQQAYYNKERYLLATCQFIVLTTSLPTSAVRQPDDPIEWTAIEELLLVDATLPACPICLHSPVAAQMTRCGHIYCYPCMLHYAALSDHAWRKCPICFESVYVSQLRSVCARPDLMTHNLAAGERLEMVLMRRHRKSTLAMPAHVYCEARSFRPTSVHDQIGSAHAKLLHSSVSHIMTTVIEREREQLRALYASEKNEPEAVFITQALKLVDVRATRLLAIVDQCAPMPPSQITYDHVTTNEKAGLEPSHTAPDSVSSSNASARTRQTSSSDSAPLGGAEEETSHYLYQVADGQTIYLSPLNARTLLVEYGNLSAAPPTIGGTVLATSQYVMCAELRARYRHLAHLPIGTTFTFVEMRLDYQLLSKATVDKFAEEFSRRSRERATRARHDTRRAERQQQWDRHVMFTGNGAPPGERDRSPPAYFAPTVVPSMSRELERVWQSDWPQPSSTIDVPLSSTSSSSVVAVSPPSFAEMIRMGKPKTTAAAVSSIMATAPADEYTPPPAASYDWLSQALESALQTKSSKQAKNKKHKNK